MIDLFKFTRSNFYLPHLFLILVVASCVAFSCKNDKNRYLYPPYPVGYIPFSDKTDKAEFKLCDERRILENGGMRTPYKGGTKAILQYFEPLMDSLPVIKHENGYLTVRFLMNCKGEKDRYRVLAINSNYRPRAFPESISTAILNRVKKMPDWTLAYYKEKAYDSYIMLTFKIEEGRIKDIIP